MKTKAFPLILGLLLLSITFTLAQSTVQVKFPTVTVKRISSGVISGPDGEIVFEIVNEDPNHQMEGFLACEVPSDVVVTSTKGAASGEQAQYISEVFIIDYAPSRRSMTLSLSSQTEGVKDLTCSVKYVLFSEEKGYVTPEGIYSDEKQYQDLTVKRDVEFVQPEEPTEEEQDWARGLRTGRVIILLSIAIAMVLVFTGFYYHFIFHKKSKEKKSLVWLIVPSLLIVCCIFALLILVLGNPPESASENDVETAAPETEPRPLPLDTCGNGVCEDYELLLTCRRDCEDLETHEYKFCRQIEGWNGIRSIRIVGTDTYLETNSNEDLVDPTGKKNPNCYSEYYALDCRRCLTVVEVHQPILEYLISPGASLSSACDELVDTLSVDGQDFPCTDNQWESIGRKVYFPYDLERMTLLERTRLR